MGADALEDIHEHVFTALLLLSDLGWVLLLPAVNPAMLIAVTMYCAYIAFVITDRDKRPHEATFWDATLIWCVGNAFWMVNDFELQNPDGVPLGIGHISEAALQRCMVAAGVILAAGLVYEIWYFVHLRFTPRFVDALGSVKVPSSSAKHHAFHGPAFLPNVLSVRSYVEYEGITHALWIAKDLCWWACVYFPGVVVLETVTVPVASALILQNLDAAVLAWRRGDVIGFVNQTTLLFWVTSFAVWCVAEVFFPEHEGPTTGDFTYLLKPPDHWQNLRWVAAWVLTIGGAFFLGFWASYACIVCAGKTEWVRRSDAGELNPLLPLRDDGSGVVHESS